MIAALPTLAVSLALKRVSLAALLFACAALHAETAPASRLDRLLLDTPFAREQEVESGRADVFMTDFPYSQRMLQNADWARLVTPPATFHLTSYAWAVKPGDDRWHARIQDFISAIKQDGRLLTAARRHKLEPIVILER